MTVSEEERITTLLRAATAPAPRVDVARAVRDGRQKRRRRTGRRIAAATVVVGLGAVGAAQLGGGEQTAPPVATSPVVSGPVVTSPAAKPVTCAVTVLPQPIAGPVAVAQHVDPSGRYVVGDIGSGQEDGRPVLWAGDAVTVLPPGAEYAAAVNSAGVVVGTDGDGKGWVYHDGTLRTLKTPPGYSRVLVHDVNDQGTAVGYAIGSADVPRAVAWSVTRPQEVRFVSAPDSVAAAIVEDGTIVGRQGGRPVRWAPSGEMTPLALPEGRTTAGVEEAHGGWAVGSVAGEKVDGATRMLPVLWNLASGAVTMVPDNGLAGVAANGDLLTGGVNPEVVSPDGGRRRLPTGGPGDYSANAISDDGMVVVGAVWHQDVYRPVVWRCAAPPR
jgi:hypothetical protein